MGVKTAAIKMLTFSIAFTLGVPSAAAQPPTAQEPVAGVASAIIKLFDRYRVVMLGEMHESIQEHALLNKLVAAPGFSERVNDIVVEVCNSLCQDEMDRYIAGEDVQADRLRLSWENVVGAPGGVAVAPYHGLYATIRSANQRLPKDRRLRVLCGDPPIDWSRVETRDDIAPFLGFRDEHYASIVRYGVLALRRKALLIMGSGHFQRREGRPGMIEQQMKTIDRADRKKQIFDIQRYLAEQMYYPPHAASVRTAGLQPNVRDFFPRSDYGLGAELVPKLWLDK